MHRSERKRFKAKLLRRIANLEAGIKCEYTVGPVSDPLHRCQNERYKVAKSRLIKIVMETYDQIPDG